MSGAVLVVAGLDPSGGAGLLADAEAIRAAGVRPLCCASAITVQTTRAVRSSHPLAPELVAAQVLALAEEEPIGAVKLGMLGSAAIAAALARLRRHPALRDLPWVIDPIFRSSSGAELIEGGPRAYDPLIEGAILTPNLAEAGWLLGQPAPRTIEEMGRAGEAFLCRGAAAALIKGGHLEGEPVDLLLDGGGAYPLGGRRRPGTRRGTGCRLASHLAARLAAGLPLREATGAAKAWVAGYLDGRRPDVATGPSSP